MNCSSNDWSVECASAGDRRSSLSSSLLGMTSIIEFFSSHLSSLSVCGLASASACFLISLKYLMSLALGETSPIVMVFAVDIRLGAIGVLF
jgi:hypothetical protein